MKKKKRIPLYMLNTLNAYQETGRIVTVYPFKGIMSLSGKRAISYDAAYIEMKTFFLARRDDALSSVDAIEIADSCADIGG